MKRFILSLMTVLLLMVSPVVQAANIPGGFDPSSDPEVWITSVYNNSGATLDVGDVVIWDIGSSTGDNDNYVTTTTTDDTHLVAGVVYSRDIGIGEEGTIAIRGPVAVDMSATTGAIVPGSAVCTSATAGDASLCGTSTTGNRLGFATSNVASNSATVYLELR